MKENSRATAGGKWRGYSACHCQVGCAQQVPQETAPGAEVPTAIFPHEEGWDDPSSHGALTIQYGSEACLTCHLVEKTDSRKAIACHECHPLYPHEPDWSNPVQHGAYVAANQTEGCATQCHGPDLGGGLSGTSCASCHAITPHSPEWVLDHGPAVLELGKNVYIPHHRPGCRTPADTEKKSMSRTEGAPHPARPATELITSAVSRV